ncbi:unnamed protein product [Caenorhabditis brenneri]
MSFKFSTYVILWFVANSAYYHIFFIRYPRQEIRTAVPAIGVLANIPMIFLMLTNTRWSLRKAHKLGFYYTLSMLLVFLLASVYLAVRMPHHHFCDDNPSPVCANHKKRDMFVALVNGLEMFLVYGGVIFLEILRGQIISAQLQALFRKELLDEDANEESSDWI